MNFGSGSVEPTRPQHEVFANDDGATNGLRTTSGNSSAAAEAWMAAAMHATQMHPAGSRHCFDQACARSLSDSLPPNGFSAWWRSSTGKQARSEHAIQLRLDYFSHRDPPQVAFRSRRTPQVQVQPDHGSSHIRRAEMEVAIPNRRTCKDYICLKWYSFSPARPQSVYRTEHRRHKGFAKPLRVTGARPTPSDWRSRCHAIQA